ncbi:hypothetical protein AVEN_155311-1 [Araneus ventricosus]|uniref:Uncharacterized protein n=1 Tax=Araneus ventricosus TaxID=182803 RepID=A0A4Y2SMK2_ARAVE|nr:hypothetical protein AVEN_155311-1 [Araneus ventricosus]
MKFVATILNGVFLSSPANIYGSYRVGNEVSSHWLSASRDLACFLISSLAPRLRGILVVILFFSCRIMEKSKLPSNCDYLGVSQDNDEYIFRIKQVEDEPSAMASTV